LRLILSFDVSDCYIGKVSNIAEVTIVKPAAHTIRPQGFYFAHKFGTFGLLFQFFLGMKLGNRVQPLLFAILSFVLFTAHTVSAQPDTWVTDFGSDYPDIPEDLIVDDAGNSYISGFFRDTLNIGAIQLVSAGKTDVFLAKFDPTGQPVWAKRFGWYENEFAHGLTFDHSGNILMVGEYQDSTIFETDTIFSLDTLYYGPYAGTYDVFWVRMTPGGVMEKVWADGWFGSENFYEVTVSPDSLYYFAGMYRTFNNWTFASIYDFRGWGRGYDDAIWVRSDTGGVMDHKAIAEGRYVDRARAIDLIGDSLVVMGGTFQDTCYFIDSVFYKVTGFEDDIFVACYSDTGLFKWVVEGGSKAIDQVNALITDPQGNIYVAGAFDSLLSMQSQTLGGAGNLDGYVLKLDKNGNLLWMKRFGGAGFDVVRDVRLMASGDLLVTGYYQRQMDLGNGVTVNLSDTLNQDAFVAKITAAGTALWVQTLGGPNPDLAVAVDEDAAGYIYAVGTFTGAGQFGQVSAEADGGEDIFLLRMNADGAVFSQETASHFGNVVLWPNPARNAFHVQYELQASGDLNLQVMDLNGRMVKSQALGRKAAGRGEVDVDCSGLPAGMYIVKLGTATAAFSGKIVLMD
jgi:hypothetical protein